MSSFDELWREAGGGTARYSQWRFNMLVEAAQELDSGPWCGDCPGRSPHLCWFAAVGAAVVQARQARRAKAPPEKDQITLFDV